MEEAIERVQYSIEKIGWLVARTRDADRRACYLIALENARQVLANFLEMQRLFNAASSKGEENE